MTEYDRLKEKVEKAKLYWEQLVKENWTATGPKYQKYYTRYNIALQELNNYMVEQIYKKGGGK